MNSREIALLTTATLFGALLSSLATRVLFNATKKKKKQISTLSCAPNDVVEGGPLCPFNPSKRKGYLSWDDYFMAIAFLSAERSKDPNRQVVCCSGLCLYGLLLFCRNCCRGYAKVGACLVSHNGVILGIGYNGFPRGCSDDELPWSKKSRSGNPLETKYPYVCHAEVNAILNTNHASAAGQKLYVTMFPCNECAKIIIQSGVSEVIYFVEKRLHDSNTAYVASHKLLSMAKIKVRKHQPEMDRILIKFKEH